MEREISPKIEGLVGEIITLAERAYPTYNEFGVYKVLKYFDAETIVNMLIETGHIERIRQKAIYLEAFYE